MNNEPFKKTLLNWQDQEDLSQLFQLVHFTSLELFCWDTINSAQRDGQRQTCVALGPVTSNAAGRTPLCSVRWRGSENEPAHHEHLQKAGDPGMAKISRQISTIFVVTFQKMGFCF